MDTRLATCPVPVTDFTHEYPWAWVFLPPLQTTFLFVEDTYQLVGIIHNTCKVWGSNPDITKKKALTIFHLYPTIEN